MGKLASAIDDIAYFLPQGDILLPDNPAPEVAIGHNPLKNTRLVYRDNKTMFIAPDLFKGPADTVFSEDNISGNILINNHDKHLHTAKGNAALTAPSMGRMAVRFSTDC